VQQTKSAEYTKALKPYVTEIKTKFKDNQEAQNRAVAKLYEDANQNPLSGCILSIVQLPVLLGLYRGIRLLALDGDLKEPFLWIPSLEGPVSAPDFRGMDWLLSGWTTLEGNSFPSPQYGWETTLAFLVMPIVLVLGQSLTMSVLSPTVDDDSQTEEEKEQAEKTQGILKFLPLMIGYFSLQVPAGLTIYWFTSNVFSLTQSLAVKAYYAANPPKIELPEYWDALENMDDMTPEQRRSAAEAGLSTAPKFSQLLEGTHGFNTVVVCIVLVLFLLFVKRWPTHQNFASVSCRGQLSLCCATICSSSRKSCLEAGRVGIAIHPSGNGGLGQER
jgi:YidC/Oxa1 family membrane protein insertase